MPQHKFNVKRLLIVQTGDKENLDMRLFDVEVNVSEKISGSSSFLSLTLTCSHSRRLEWSGFFRAPRRHSPQKRWESLSLACAFPRLDARASGALYSILDAFIKATAGKFRLMLRHPSFWPSGKRLPSFIYLRTTGFHFINLIKWSQVARFDRPPTRLDACLVPLNHARAVACLTV